MSTSTTDVEVTDATAPGPERGPRVLVGLVAGLAVVLCLMLLAFAAPSVHSGPHDLPLAVAGPEAAVGQVEQALQQARPGAFEVDVRSDESAVRQAIREREAIGGVVVGADGARVLTASAAGAPYVQVLTGIATGLQAGGQQVTTEDVVPLSADDPAGAGITALGLPLVFGGMISAVALSNLFKRSRRLRVAGSVAFSVVAGLAATAVLRFWIGTFEHSYWAVAGSVALGIGAISLLVLGLESRFGYAGLGVGGALMMFVANPLSGLATGPLWLPQPWGEIGQWLPVGAAGTMIRSTAFFDGGSTHALLVLSAYVVVGLLLIGLTALHARRAGRHEATA